MFLVWVLNRTGVVMIVDVDKMFAIMLVVGVGVGCMVYLID